MSLEAIIAIGFVALIAIETTISWLHNLRTYEFRDTAANFALAFGDLLMAAAMKAVFLVLFALLHRFAPLDMGLSWMSWALLVVINDFIYYVFHRLGHRCRFMWAFHVTHHSSQKYNFSVAVRLNLFILPLHFLFMLPLALLGFRPEAILAINSITTLYQLWVHTELVGKLGFLDRVLNTPSNHRVHHGSNPQYLDRNYGAMFIFWDHLFGTYEPEGEPVVYGLTKNVGSHNPVTLTFHEVRSMVRDVMRSGPLRQRLMYLFGPPGWRPAPASEALRRASPGDLARRVARPPRLALLALPRVVRHVAAALYTVARRARPRPYQPIHQTTPDSRAIAPHAAHRPLHYHRRH
ncbi:MAG: sterol desaturase family protein [Spirochaetaceae bacterium]|nr:sterol desaturase family protein [Spirochaetaceae bacterium]